MDYHFSEDLQAIREIRGISQQEFAMKLGVQQVTISRNELGKTSPSANFMEQVYNYAFDHQIRLGRLKEMLWQELMDPGHKLLFHGAKNEIVGQISTKSSRTNNDFGQGFYAGEAYEQAIAFVSGFEHSSVYYLDFDNSNLSHKDYHVDQDWMLTIAYFRGTLDEYKDHPVILKLAEEARRYDYIIAPIADNRMFQIINSFIEGEITDEQCKHCLAATNLGRQYVFITDKAVRNLKILERGYISGSERRFYTQAKSDEAKLGEDKVKLARRQYRGKGKYIDDILQ